MATTETETVKLVPHGKELALLIDPQLLRELSIDENTPLKIMSDGEVLVILPVANGADEAKFDKALAELHSKYGRMLKRLAE